MIKYDVAIVGGGASGLTCALALKRLKRQAKVCVIDACDRLGKKLAATGNGQGNVSNINLTAGNYHGGGSELAYSIIGGDYNLPASLFNCILTCDDEGRIYPSGRQASALSDSLIRELNSLGAVLITSTRVTQVKKGFELSLSDGGRICADRVVLACGGKAQKQFGTDGSSYALAESLGHSITPLYPSLVQLKTDTTYTKTLKGIRAECVLSAEWKGRIIKQSRGDVIFTDYGISGNAVFLLSSAVADKTDVTVHAEFLPGVGAEQIVRDIKLKQKLGYPQSELLSGTLHNQLGRAIIKRTRGGAEDIAKAVKDFTLPVKGTLGFDYAQVTRGGIDCSLTDENLESKVCKDLYFTGEYLDVDGDCGGYNLLWAFASGVHVANRIAGEL